MNNLPDWLIERVALEEVPPASRDRVARADANEVAERVATLRADNAAELAAYPAAPAVAQIAARVTAAKQVRASRRRRLGLVGVMASAAVAVLVIIIVNRSVGGNVTPVDDEGEEITRVKGKTRLVVFRHAGDHIERLDQDEVVHEGDLLQVRYKAGGRGYGVIASIDGAGAVTLHHPASEDAAPEATALSAKTTSLPNAYALDDAPNFERFFFITSDEPIDVKQSLAALRTLAQSDDGATASLELPKNFNQWSLRLRKPSK